MKPSERQKVNYNLTETYAMKGIIGDALGSCLDKEEDDILLILRGQRKGILQMTFENSERDEYFISSFHGSAYVVLSPMNSFVPTETEAPIFKVETIDRKKDIAYLVETNSNPHTGIVKEIVSNVKLYYDKLSRELSEDNE